MKESGACLSNATALAYPEMGVNGSEPLEAGKRKPAAWSPKDFKKSNERGKNLRTHLPWRAREIKKNLNLPYNKQWEFKKRKRKVGAKVGVNDRGGPISGYRGERRVAKREFKGGLTRGLNRKHREFEVNIKKKEDKRKKDASPKGETTSSEKQGKE